MKIKHLLGIGLISISLVCVQPQIAEASRGKIAINAIKPFIKKYWPRVINLLKTIWDNIGKISDFASLASMLSDAWDTFISDGDTQKLENKLSETENKLKKNGVTISTYNYSQNYNDNTQDLQNELLAAITKQCANWFAKSIKEQNPELKYREIKK